MANLQRHNAASRYWVFRGAASGRPVAWGTSAVVSAEGAIDPIMVEPPSAFSVGPSTVLGEQPPKTSTSIVLADPEGEIASWLLPDRRGRVDLRGRIYEGIVGQPERPVTPTLIAAGNPSVSQGALSVSLQVDDSGILGRPVALWTVRELLEHGTLVNIDLGNPSSLEDYLAGQPPEVLWGRMRETATESMDVIVPWSYGGITELIPVSDAYPRFWISHIGGRGDPWMSDLIREVDGRHVSAAQEPGVPSTDPASFSVWLSIPDHLGVSREIMLQCYCAPLPPEEEPSRYILAPSYPPALRAGSAPPIDRLMGWGSPPAVLAWIVATQSARGIDALHEPSFRRVIRECDPVFGDACAGVYGSEGATIGEVLEHLAPLCGMRVWVGLDDRLHVALSGYTREDAEEAAGDLPLLHEGDIYPADADGSPAWSSEIIGDPDDDGAGVERVSVAWPELQRLVYPIQTSSAVSTLAGDAATAGVERVVSGAWIRAERGEDVAVALQSMAAGDAARVTMVTHPDLRVRRSLLPDIVIEPASLMRVSHPHGLGLPGLGWDRRLVRVDTVETLPGESAARLQVTDLGLSERLRLGLLDTWQQWALYVSQPGQTLYMEVENGEVVFQDLHLYVPFTIEENMTIWTPGAEHPGNRQSWRVIEFDGKHARAVPWKDTDDLMDGDVQWLSDWPGFLDGRGWFICTTDYRDPFFREHYIRACEVDAGFFESGEPGFQFSAY